jgi:hypothetical protein
MRGMEEIYHEGGEGARIPGMEGVFHSFVFLASRSWRLGAPSWFEFLFPVPSLIQ